MNNSRWLTKDFTTAEPDRSSALNVVYSGARSLQVAQLLGAQSARLLDRGNATLRLEFTVEELHASAAEAQATVLTALEGTLEGDAEVFCGDATEGYLLVRLVNAVLSALEESGSRGVRSRVRYRLEAARAVLEADAELPGEAAAATVQSGLYATLDGGRYGVTPGFGAAAAGTLDGGNYADALLPTSLGLAG